MKLKSGQAMEEGVNIDGKKLNRYNDRHTGSGDSDGKGLYSQYNDGHTGGGDSDGKGLYSKYNDGHTGGGDSDGKGLYSQYNDGHTGVRSYTEYYDEHIGDGKGILMVRDSTVCTTTGSRDEDSVKQSTMGLNRVHDGHTGGGDSDGKRLYSQDNERHTGGKKVYRIL